MLQKAGADGDFPLPWRRYSRPADAGLRRFGESGPGGETRMFSYERHLVVMLVVAVVIVVAAVVAAVFGVPVPFLANT